MKQDYAKQYLPHVDAFGDGELQSKSMDGRWIDWPEGLRCDFSDPPDFYRRRPKKIECWAVVSPNGAQYLFSIEDHAKQWAINNGRIVHLKEVE